MRDTVSPEITTLIPHNLLIIMKIQRIVGENGDLSAPCSGGTCPTAILTEENEVFVQGYVLSDSENEKLNAPPGEGFVRIPRDTFDKILNNVLK